MIDKNTECKVESIRFTKEKVQKHYKAKKVNKILSYNHNVGDKTSSSIKKEEIIPENYRKQKQPQKEIPKEPTTKELRSIALKTGNSLKSQNRKSKIQKPTQRRMIRTFRQSDGLSKLKKEKMKSSFLSTSWPGAGRTCARSSLRLEYTSAPPYRCGWGWCGVVWCGVEWCDVV